MHDPRANHEHGTRQSRSPSQAATIMLALFVFAAIPAVSVAQGLDAAVLAELMRDEGRRLPPREPDPTSKGFRAAVTLAKRLGSSSTQRIARPRAIIVHRIDAPPAVRAALAALRPAPTPLRESLLSLPPPAL